METKNILIRTDFPETNEVYEAPVIETIAVEVERGFALSDDPNDTPWSY